MTFAEFKSSLSQPGPPKDVSGLLRAMWYDGRNDWESAHTIAQEISSPDGSWVHAYLHRKEGDVANAGYWYRRAGRAICLAPLEQEWDEIASELLSR